jgi:glycosyltransferase involved in cell wall biosynthesis
MHPFVSFVIPTFNAEKWLPSCLSSIFAQNYPKEAFEVVTADGGSGDSTVRVAKSFGARVLKNPYRDAQIGKAIGLRRIRPNSQYVILMDADNEIVQKNWLSNMIGFLEKEPTAFGAYSDFLALKEDPAINRVSVLLPSEDPIAARIANIHNLTSFQDLGHYKRLEIKPRRYPVFGANGFIWRRSILFRFFTSDLKSFDEADLSTRVVAGGYKRILCEKKMGLYHHHVYSIRQYIRKRIRSATEYMIRTELKKGNCRDIVWTKRYRRTELVMAAVFCMSIFGPLHEAVRHYRQDKDTAWFLYPVLAFLGVFVYGLTFIFYRPRLDHHPLSNKNKHTVYGWNKHATLS